jgi:hypothetical protein
MLKKFEQARLCAGLFFGLSGQGENIDRIMGAGRVPQRGVTSLA